MLHQPSKCANQLIWGAVMTCLSLSLTVAHANSCQAQTPPDLEFHLKLEVIPAPFTDGYAYLRGNCKFIGQKGVYRCELIIANENKVVLAPGVIQITDVIFRVTDRRGNEISSQTLDGFVFGASSTMVLGDGSDPVLTGSIRAWYDKDGIRGPMVIKGSAVAP